jgi:Ca2+-binding EF-hand superfamily protein
VNLGIDVAAEEIHNIIQSADIMGNGKINYSEFIIATMDLKQVVTREKL